MSSEPSITLSDLIAPLINEIKSGEIEIYNEISLQHELGIFLRHLLPNSKIYFERNVRTLFSTDIPFTKREIDIVIVSKTTGHLQWAIELKFPRNGQHPEQMFSFCKDVAFLEELKSAGFPQTGFVVFAEDALFWQGSSPGIYAFFRGSAPLTGTIQKPTGKRDETVSIRGNYKIDWTSANDRMKYAALDIA